jgi:hypothetical protein
MNTVIKKAPEGGPMLIYGSQSPVALMQVSSAVKTKAAGGSKDENVIPYVGSSASKDEEEGKKEWVKWGVNDDFPQVISKLIRKSTVGRAGLQYLTKTLYGQRMITYKLSGVNHDEMELVSIPQWEAIMARSNMDRLRLALCQDHSYFQLSMPQVRFNGNKTEIWSFEFHKTSHCRFAPMDPKTGRIPFVFVSGNFPDVKAEDCQKIPVIDEMQMYDQLEEIRNDFKNFKYVIPQSWPDVINDYYPVAFWDSARESGYLDIAISIPAYIKALFKNQMSLKYHIDIPMEYFEDLYKNTWHGLSDDEKDGIFTELYDKIVEQLTGAENAQKAIMTFSRTGSNGKPIGQWTITVIDDKSQNSGLLPNASAANLEILFGMGINPATSGAGNTGSSATGGANNGGSNIRESGLTQRATLQADRDIMMNFFNFFKAWYGIDPTYQLGIQDMVLTTLDKGKGTEKVVS